MMTTKAVATSEPRVPLRAPSSFFVLKGKRGPLILTSRRSTLREHLLCDERGK